MEDIEEQTLLLTSLNFDSMVTKIVMPLAHSIYFNLVLQDVICYCKT